MESVGRSHSIVTTEATATRTVARPGAARLKRAVDLAGGLVLLVLALPALAAIALAVRLSSHGPVLRRDGVLRPGGARIELLSFRTVVDGGDTAAHERLRAVIGAPADAATTGVGRVLRRTRLDRLPRLLNVVRGQSSFFR
jgi:lipopolysaccharide/colanic/teichoic acid biosynthesis glycosyltransferase